MMHEERPDPFSPLTRNAHVVTSQFIPKIAFMEVSNLGTDNPPRLTSPFNEWVEVHIVGTANEREYGPAIFGVWVCDTSWLEREVKRVGAFPDNTA